MRELGNAVSSSKSMVSEECNGFTTQKNSHSFRTTGGVAPRKPEKSGLSYNKHVSIVAQANKDLNQYKERNESTMDVKEYVTFNTVLDQFVVNKAAIKESCPKEKQEALLKYCETSCRFQNRTYGRDTTQLDRSVQYQMDHLDPEVLRRIQLEILHTYPGKKRSEIVDFDTKVLNQIEEIYRIILGNGTRQLAIKRAYREAYPYLQAGTGSKWNTYDNQIPFEVLDQVRQFHIRPHHIRIYRMLIKIQDPLKSKLFTMEDLEIAVQKAEEYYRGRLEDVPELMIVTRPDSIALVKKHIRWFTDSKEFILHNIPETCKYGTITTPNKVYRILLSNCIHRHFCPKVVPEEKSFIYTDWEGSQPRK